ncbi:LVIVD repeat-containing protein [Larkinella arboricola]|uniref:LVIVD repeat-containing protein n=1 Tax=Larkinella arboricola TaxID=643671 RepID=A0A327WM33_LARAB|nr:hypothetical protein [Larkinella arboricola]RAJ92471.1 LVIVD repeat-containing protein [Larkinella arboricola]
MKHLSYPSLVQQLTVSLLLLTAFGCETNTEVDTAQQVQGLRPVYASYEDVRTIETLEPQPLKNPGKIYIKGGYLFINEQGRGVHIIDNSNPAKPQKISFVSVPGNIDMAVKDQVLYVDNSVDLVALDIADPRQVTVLKRIKDAYPYPSYPSQRGVPFECADPEKGVVVRWETARLTNPKCFR